jgi:hypothetical protein
MADTYKISNWYGRFGNNLLQINNAVYRCLKDGKNLIFPKHDFLNTQEINFFETSNNLISHSDLFWGDNIDDSIRRQISIKYLKNIINFNEVEIDNDTLVFHLRGGDIFSNNAPNNYVQAPYSYIKEVINFDKPKKIIIVYEDCTNPIIDKMREDYSNLLEQVNDINNGINILMSAKKIAYTGISTFPRMLVMGSNLVNTIYVPAFLKDEVFYNGELCNFSDTEIKQFNINNYIKFGEWKWDEEMKQIFLYK